MYDHFGNKKKIIQNNTFSNYQPVLTNNNCPIPNNYHTEEVTVPYNIYTGKIVDENNLPIENATIVAKDTKFGSDENRLCFSDSQGNFIIHFKGTANSITVSALGKLTTVIWKYDEDPVNIITLTSAECNQLSANRIANLDENEIKPEGYQYSIDEISTIVYLYPNPTEDQIEIKSDLNKFNKIDIFSPTFKLIFSKEFNLAANKTAINFSSYSRGVYYVRIHLLDGSISTIKLIKI